jgi:hypothetical protein
MKFAHATAHLINDLHGGREDESVLINKFYQSFKNRLVDLSHQSGATMAIKFKII